MTGGAQGDAHLLDNIFWNTLVGPHAHLAVGSGAARRYGPGFSAIAGFADAKAPDLDALAPYCAAGEPFYCAGWSGPVPDGWRVEVDGTMFCMVWDAPAPRDDAAPQAARLGPQHVAQAIALTELTHPGPFGPRTLELGEYFGLFGGDAGDELIAMAGERTQAGSLREVSGVCTHPAHQGQGLARRLMLKVIQRQMQRGQTPFLHVMSGNAGARALYRRMGFRDRHETVVRVVARLP